MEWDRNKSTFSICSKIIIVHCFNFHFCMGKNEKIMYFWLLIVIKEGTLKNPLK